MKKNTGNIARKSAGDEGRVGRPALGAGAEGLFSPAQLAEAARIFAVMADESRLRLLQVLLGGRRVVGALVEATGLSQANASKHLQILHEAGLVSREKQGNFVVYSVRDTFVKKLCELICGRMQKEAARRAQELGGRR
jgi:DNA-binding transcriptional ArsR family regulator